MSDDIGLAALEEIEGTSEVQAITTRVFADSIPQGAMLPAVRVEVVSNNAIEHLGGSSLSVARVRVDAVVSGNDREAANQLAETIRTKAMQSTFKGTMGSSHTATVREITLVAGPYWEQERPRPGDDKWRARTRCDYLVTYQQTGPS